MDVKVRVLIPALDNRNHRRQDDRRRRQREQLHRDPDNPW
jgi:hypothetical protein